MVRGSNVKQAFIEKSILLIKANKVVTALDEKKLKYGLECFYNMVTKTVVMIILAFILNIVWEFFLLTVIYSTLRMYGFGIHMKTSLQCWVTTLPIYIGGCLLVKYITFSNTFIQLLWTIGFLSFLLFAPADTPKRPLIHKEKRIRAKILSLIILGFYFVLSFYITDPILKNLIIYALFMESISINPLMYKVFKTPFNNYKLYQKKMV